MSPSYPLIRKALFWLLCLLVLAPSAGHAAKWKDVPPELLALSKNPYDPGASALIIFNDGSLQLFWRDDLWWEMEVYRRIKIFSDEGKRYATVAIPYFNEEEIRDVKARIIFQDGRNVDMPKDQIITEKVFSVAMQKKFTIPGVTNGAIIEYQYRKKSQDIVSLDTWNFEMEDYTLSSTLTATIPREIQYTGSYVNLLSEPKTDKVRWIDGRGTTYSWTVQNMPSVKSEPFSRPARKLRAGMQFIISGFHNGFSTQGLYDNWKTVAKDLGWVLEYTGKRGNIPAVVQEITAGLTDPEEKIARIYDYVQRHIDPLPVEGLYSTGNYSGTILANKQAEHLDMNVLLCAMLSEAGFKSNVALVATHDGQPFSSGFTCPAQFERWLTTVDLGPDKTVWLDPIITGTPYGILPWQDEEMPALPVKGQDLTTTPKTSFLNSETRSFKIALSPEGHLAGQGVISASGQNAIRYRRLFTFSKEDKQKETLLNDVREFIPDADVTAFEFKDQITAAKPVELSFSFNASDYATIAGNRLLINPALYERIDRDFLPETTRHNPIQLGYVTTRTDEVILAIPEGYAMEQLPVAANLKSAFGRFYASFQNTPEGILYKRSISIIQPNGSVEFYPDLREFYSRISEMDQQQIVLIQKESR